MDDYLTIGLLSLAVGLVFAFFFAHKFSEIAEMKGHDGSPYFWYVLLFGVVGMIMVAALPNLAASERKEQKNQVFNNVSVRNGSVVETKYIVCTSCKRKITHYPCEHCGHQAEDKTAPYWCGKCGYLGPYADKCPKCNSGIKIFNTKL